MNRRIFLGKSLACSAITFSGAGIGVAAEPKKEPGVHFTQPVNKSRLVFPKNQARKTFKISGNIDTGEDLWKPTIVTLKITHKNNSRYVIAAYSLKPEMIDGKLQISVDVEATIKKGRYHLSVLLMTEVPSGGKEPGKLLKSNPVPIEFEIVEK